MNANRRLVIMITDMHGSKFINVSMIFKQVGIYLFVLFLTLGLFAYISIVVIRNEVSSMTLFSEHLMDKLTAMQQHNEKLEMALKDKNEDIALVGDRFEDIENIVGVSKNLSQDTLLNNDETNIIDRMNIASITALQKTFIMKFIPNGSPINIDYRISSPYGKRYHPILHIYHIHTGTDMVVPMNTPVYATADGVVDWASSSGNGGYGKLVKISHSFGFRTYYAHLNDIKVQRGQFVKKGQLVALSGSSGASTGPHLHYEIRFLGQPIDPMNFVHWNMQNFDLIFEKERRISWHSLLQIINNLMGKKQQEQQQ